MSDERVPLPAVGGGPGGERCDKCYYYADVESNFDDQGEAGTCRRKPAFASWNDPDNRFEGDCFPIARPGWWCGEFRPRAGEPAKPLDELLAAVEKWARAGMSPDTKPAVAKRVVKQLQSKVLEAIEVFLRAKDA